MRPCWQRACAAGAVVLALTARDAPALECLVPLEGEAAAQPIDDLKVRGGRLLLRSGGRSLRITESGRWVATAETATGWVYDAESLDGGRALIGAEKGLFRSDGSRRLIRVAPGLATGPVTDIEMLGPGRILVGAWRGVFRFDGVEHLVAVATGPEVGRIRDVERLGDGRGLAGGDRGLFEFGRDGRLRRVPGGADIGVVSDIESLRDGRVLVAAERGLFELAEDDGLRQVHGDLAGIRVNEIRQLRDARIVLGTALGALQLTASAAAAPIPTRGAPGEIVEIEELRDGRVVAGGARGVFRGVRTPIAEAEIRIVTAAGGSPAAIPGRVAFTLLHPCAGAAGLDVRVSWALDDGERREVRAELDGGAVYTALRVGARVQRLRVSAFSATARGRVALGAPLEIRASPFPTRGGTASAGRSARP